MDINQRPIPNGKQAEEGILFSKVKHELQLTPQLKDESQKTLGQAYSKS